MSSQEIKVWECNHDSHTLSSVEFKLQFHGIDFMKILTYLFELFVLITAAYVTIVYSDKWLSSWENPDRSVALSFKRLVNEHAG